MNRDICRTIGALAGLTLGIALMRLLGLTGMVNSAVFWAGGTVAGGIGGEQYYRWQSRGER